jgi:hypothetical protein
VNFTDGNHELTNCVVSHGNSCMKISLNKQLCLYKNNRLQIAMVLLLRHTAPSHSSLAAKLYI